MRLRQMVRAPVGSLLEEVNLFAEDMIVEGQAMIALIVLEVELRLLMRDCFGSQPSWYGAVWTNMRC